MTLKKIAQTLAPNVAKFGKNAFPALSASGMYQAPMQQQFSGNHQQSDDDGGPSHQHGSMQQHYFPSSSLDKKKKSVQEMGMEAQIKVAMGGGKFPSGGGGGGKFHDLQELIDQYVRARSEGEDYKELEAELRKAIDGSPAAKDQREFAEFVLSRMTLQLEPGSVAEVAREAVSQFTSIMSAIGLTNYQSSKIGSHYLFEAFDDLSKPASKASLKALAVKETAWWKDPGFTKDRWMGAMISAKCREYLLQVTACQADIKLTGDQQESPDEPGHH
jgi:hypothetical protein